MKFTPPKRYWQNEKKIFFQPMVYEVIDFSWVISQNVALDLNLISTDDDD